LTGEWIELAERADALCFGSLAQRSRRVAADHSGAGGADPGLVRADLRREPATPFYSAEVIRESLELATVLKMNDAELPRVLALLGLKVVDELAPGPLRLTDERQGAARLLREFPSLQMVAVTRGAHGSLLVTREAWHEHPGIPVKVADTIGAGDAFTAAMTHYLLRGADLATLNEAGNRWGSWVASQPGAMPAIPDKSELQYQGDDRGLSDA
jgi:fructokinase